MDEQGRLHAIAKPVTLTRNDGSRVTTMFPTVHYIWGPDRVLAKVDKITNQRYYYLYNGHYDVVQIVDTAGNIVNQYDYDVWGNFLTKTETIENHFTYFGQTYDETTGLYYLRARYYDPTIGRFTGQDPAEDGYNWYVYGNQNPIMFADYSGANPLIVATAIVAAGVVDGVSTGFVYKFSGKRFGAGFINGFVEGLSTGVGTYIGGVPGAVIGNTLGSALGSMSEDLIYNKDKSVEEIAKSAAQSAAWGLVCGLTSAYLDDAIKIANEASSAAQTLMQYDEKFGKALKIFFEQLVNILSSQ